MPFRFYSQVKGMINLLMSVAIAIAVGFLQDSKYAPYPFIIISVAFIVQVCMLFIRSVEEKHFDKDVSHMQKERDIDHTKDEKVKEIKNNEKILKMRKEANKLKGENKPKNKEVKDYDNFIKALNELNNKKIK